MAIKKTSSLSKAAQQLGRQGGLKGGPARDKALSTAQKVAIGRKGAEAKNRAPAHQAGRTGKPSNRQNKG